MATLNKFHVFVEHLVKGVHNLSAHTLKVYLTNVAPDSSTMSVKADLAEISAGAGYPAGGNAVTITGSSHTGGAYRLAGVSTTFAVSGGSVGPFRYVVLYNSTPTSPPDPLIGWGDYGRSITLLDGDGLTVDFAATILALAE